MITEERRWNSDLLREHMQEPDVGAILNIPLSFVNFEDTQAWHDERLGYFTVQSAYRLLAETKNKREVWLCGRAESFNMEDKNAIGGGCGN